MDKKPIIFDYNNYIINENLKFKNPETRNNNVFIPIKYDNKSLLFKTPRLYMPFKPHINKNQNQNQNQTKARETCPTQCNKRKLSSRKQHNDNNTLYPKTLTAETQCFQMRKMNQR